jgi:hypothetical protein
MRRRSAPHPFRLDCWIRSFYNLQVSIELTICRPPEAGSRDQRRPKDLIAEATLLMPRDRLDAFSLDSISFIGQSELPTGVVCPAPLRSAPQGIRGRPAQQQ